MKKYTTEEYIEKARKIHGDKYDYSKVEYTHSNANVTAICPIHGEFTIRANNFLRGIGCPKCGGCYQMNLTEWVERANKKHGFKYDYSQTEYIKAHDKVRIICHKKDRFGNEHGEFYQDAASHLSGCGCPKCGREAERKISHKFYKDNGIRREEFIRKAQSMPEHKSIDYSKVEYIDNRTPVCLIDNDLREDGTIYGEFWQSPSNHLKGRCHPDKRGKNISSNKSMSRDEVIELFRKAHPNENLDYSEVEYVNMHTKVKIISHELRPDGTEYGEFWQEPCVHIKGCSHPDYGKAKQIKSQTLTTEEFIEKAKLIHGDKYGYSMVQYVNNRTKVDIICPIHGVFKAIPDNFIHGKGCPSCGCINSKVEREIASFVGQYSDSLTFNNRTVLDGHEIDILDTERKIGIEYNGLHWHTEEFGKGRNYHLDKLNECNEKGIKLIQIFEDEYLHHKDIVESKILHILGLGRYDATIGGSKCIVREIDTDTARTFLDTYHIQGFGKSTVYIGAYSKRNNVLVGVMSFKKERNSGNDWELTRFATDYHYKCPGVGGKLFSHFIKNYSPNKIKSFADRRWTLDADDNLYTKLGFILAETLAPDYRYVVGDERLHKFGFRKQTLHRKYGLSMDMTESEMTKELGFYRIWDCGLLRYEWNKE